MITLNYRDARPIYEQVCDGLRRLIVSGAIADGEKLPSVRALASQLAINPNTIQRAYSELESEGYAASVPGKGSFAVRRERAEDEVLPWDHIDAGVTKEFLLREQHKAERGETTPDCRKGCQGCGLQRYEGACRK